MYHIPNSLMYGRTYIVEDEKFNKSLIPTFAAALNEKLNRDMMLQPTHPVPVLNE